MGMQNHTPAQIHPAHRPVVQASPVLVSFTGSEMKK